MFTDFICSKSERAALQVFWRHLKIKLEKKNLRKITKKRKKKNAKIKFQRETFICLISWASANSFNDSRAVAYKSVMFFKRPISIS